jgi:glucose/arabinose dehydrogenase
MLLLTAALAFAPQADEAQYYTVDYLTPPEGEVIEVGGMAFLSDGTMLVSTRRGRVWWIDNADAEDPADAKFHIFAEGLHEGLGLTVRDDRIYLAQRGELSELIDLDGDQVCDRIETITQDWGMSGNYHEFAFGLPIDDEGNFYMGTNVGFWSPEWWHGLSVEPNRGWILKISPEGDVTPYSSGVRGPAGMGFDAEGRLLFTENQGDWIPAGGLFEVKGGEFFSHPASLRWTEEYGNGELVPSSLLPPKTKRTPPAVWIPYEWSRSSGNMVPIPDHPALGKFKDQLLIAELTNGLVFRALLEEVQGQTQGAVVLFRQEVGSAFRLQFGPTGTLFVGMTNRGWGGRAPGSGIARLNWTGEEALEYQEINLRDDGFQLKFTQALEAAPDPATIEVYTYDYNWWWDYGSPMMRRAEHAVSSATLSADGRDLKITIPDLEAGRCVRVKIPGIGLLHDEFDYTINQLPSGPWSDEMVAKLVEPPSVRESDEAGWLTMTWGDPFAAFDSEGWELVAADLDPADPTKFLITQGNSALVNSGANVQDFRSKAEFGDIAFRFNFMLPEGGDSGLYLMDRYELQLNDNPDQCCGVIGSKNPRAKGYRGPGQWHKVAGQFYAPRFDADGNKIANARFENITVDGLMVIGSAECNGVTGGAISQTEVAKGPLRFQATAGTVAMGDIRIKVLQEGEAVADNEGWTALTNETEPTGRDFELRGRMTLSDGGSAALDMFLPTQDALDTSEGGMRLVLDHSGPGATRTGSLGDLAPLTTQFIQAGIPFDLALKCYGWGPGIRVDVWLNGVLINELVMDHPPVPGYFRLRPEITPGTELEVESLEIRSL